MIEILDEQVISQRGCFRQIRRWLRGAHPELGVLVWGLTGLETVQETTAIKPLGIFTVLTENESNTKIGVCPEPPVLPLHLPGDQQPQSQPQSEPRAEAA